MWLDIWMRENPITYVLLGSYAVAMAIFLVEIAMVRHKRALTLQQVRLMQEAGEEE